MTYRLTPAIADALVGSGQRIVVTGGGGWLGMATLELLSAALGGGFTNRVHCFGSRHRALTLLDGTRIDQVPLADIANLTAEPTIVLHFAFLTKDRGETMDEAAYRAANRSLDRLVRDALEPIGATAIFVASSGAAYRADDPAASPAMRLYATLKRDQERCFADWAAANGRRAVIARIFNLSGPHISAGKDYALGAFIRDALAGRPIAIHAPHRVVRGYVAIRELMSLAFALLLDAAADTVRFDSGGEPMEMEAVAQVVADTLGPVPVTRPPVGEAPVDHYVGDSAAYNAMLAGRQIEAVPFARQVVETAEGIKIS